MPAARQWQRPRRRRLRACVNCSRRYAAGGGGDPAGPGAGEGGGVWAPFFGKPAYTMTLPARMAESTDAAVLFFYGERLPFGAWLSRCISARCRAHSAVIRNTMPSCSIRNVEALIRGMPGAISVEL